MAVSRGRKRLYRKLRRRDLVRQLSRTGMVRGPAPALLNLPDARFRRVFSVARI